MTDLDDTAPPAVGYMLISDDDLEQAERLEEALSAYARARGLRLGDIVFTWHQGTGAGFAKLSSQVRRDGARHVVVPSMTHFAAHPLLQQVMVATLQGSTGVEVLELPPGGEPASHGDVRRRTL